MHRKNNQKSSVFFCILTDCYKHGGIVCRVLDLLDAKKMICRKFINEVVASTRLKKKNRGVTTMEYVLIVTILIVSLIAAYKKVGKSYVNLYDHLSCAIP